MALNRLLLASLATSAASATKLWVTSYAAPNEPLGKITTLELSANGNSVSTLSTLSTNQECGSAPTWLDLSLGNGRIVCVDEGFATPNASIVTLEIAADGSLTAVGKADTIQGPVSTQFYNNNTAVALAHYGGSAISTFKVAPDGSYAPLQNFTFAITPGPRPEQEASHVHHSVIDPTGQYIVFPDLGADATYVYAVDKSTGNLKQLESIKAPKPGYGPRHATFWVSSNKKTYLFVINELANRIVSYAVDYKRGGGVSFKQVDEVGLYGDKPDPEGTRAAEISVSPDNNFIIASNRNATIAEVANPDPSNSTQVPSDSLVTFKPCKDGKLTFVQLAPSGGKFPRHFKTNKDGSLIAIPNQNSGNVDVYARDVKSGKIGDRLASAFGFAGGLTNVQWGEE
ncbi:putative isomerase YbhE [Corynespora cassiicola Philippines]|uniref:Putative isomerase YbhE n=1 Tax=Corynespora cassiicola Philippines TaxID=1448308 RepID=A0A2T2NY70_CORCC|nr:putative isomerase YbhE [Corynespora cassiicola Philippines]